MKKTMLITGGSGFIGSNFVRKSLRQGYSVVNVDALTYATFPDSLKDIEGDVNYTFIHGKIQDEELVESIFHQYKPNFIINFAAESHVDRSIDNPKDFIETNITGTFVLLQATRAYIKNISEENKEMFRFLHISTDEVFGSAEKVPFREEDAYNPSSPYAASKAASDHLVNAYYKTYNMPLLITNCTNNYGPYQFPEKLIPHIILCALEEKSLPIYGDGMQIRDWLHVDDHVEALLTVLENGRIGESYNIAGLNDPIPNKEVVLTICEILDKLQPRKNRASYKELITYVKDRPGHDRRYALDSSKIKKDLAWMPKHDFRDGLEKTVRWYLDNRWWWNPILQNGYEVKRIGTGEV